MRLADLPHTQASKKEAVAAAHQGHLPSHVVYVPTSFNARRLPEEMQAAGFQTDLRTLWLQEGVLNYLEVPAIDATFAFMRESSASGSVVVCDYLTSEVGVGERIAWAALAWRLLRPGSAAASPRRVCPGHGAAGRVLRCPRVVQPVAKHRWCEACRPSVLGRGGCPPHVAL